MTKSSVKFPLGISGHDCQVCSLQRSQLVYRCDIFSHSVSTASSSLFQDCVPLSSTQEPVAQLRKETAQSLSQQRFQHFETPSQSNPFREKRNNVPIRQMPCQRMDLMELQDLSYMADFMHPSNYDDGEQPTADFNCVNWFDPQLGLYPEDQHQALPLSLPELPDVGRSLVEETTALSHPEGQWPEDGWDIQGPEIKCSRLCFQDLPEPPSRQCLFDSPAVPISSDLRRQPHILPPTPPCSTRSEGASPAGDLGESHQYALQLPTEHPSTPPNELSTWNEESTMLAPPQQPAPEIMWSDEDFARFLDSDPFRADLNSLDHGPNGQSMLSAGSQCQSPGPGQSNSHRHYQHQQRDWHSLTSYPPLYSHEGPSFPVDIFQHADTLMGPVGAMPNYNFGFANQSLATTAPTSLPSLFEGLSPDVDPSTVHRRSGAKAPQRASAKDLQLVEWKNQGLSYKEIKERGGFEEAESTLRGRYRTLTKPKHLRVRKPEWPEKDVRILLEAVDRLQNHVEVENAPERYASEAQRKAAKVPWKQVAEYMEKQGCYRYGNATVKKKYLTVMEDALHTVWK